MAGKNSGSFFTTDIRETEYRQQLGWLSDNIDTGKVGRIWGEGKRERERQTENETAREQVRRRRWRNKRYGANEPRTCLMHVFHTGMFTSSIVASMSLSWP